VEIVLVVEGAARGVESVPGVRVDSAPGSGDDRMVELVAEAGGRRCLVVTADRELRRRVAELGAEVAGPRVMRP
jgi:rRNA-processing protein FCF1